MGCIYPGVEGQHDDLSSEHVLPRGLGRFSGLGELKNRICGRCNTRLGNQCDLPFLWRSGPNSFFRWIVGAEGYDGAPPSPFYQRAAGNPPIFVVGRAPDLGYDLFIEIERRRARSSSWRNTAVAASPGGPPRGPA